MLMVTFSVTSKLPRMMPLLFQGDPGGELYILQTRPRRRRWEGVSQARTTGKKEKLPRGTGNYNCFCPSFFFLPHEMLSIARLRRLLLIPFFLWGRPHPPRHHALIPSNIWWNEEEISAVPDRSFRRRLGGVHWQESWCGRDRNMRIHVVSTRTSNIEGDQQGDLSSYGEKLFLWFSGNPAEGKHNT